MKSIIILGLAILSLAQIPMSFAVEQRQILGKWISLGSAKSLVDDRSKLKSYYKKGEFIWHFTKDNNLNVLSPGEKDVIPFKISGEYLILKQSGFEGKMKVVKITETELIVINPLGNYEYYEKSNK
mgnify:FL=1